MRLLMLIPIFILMGVSGYNLAGGYDVQTENSSITPEILHMSIILLCVAGISLIVRSAFKVQYKEVDMPQKVKPLYQRLAQQLHL